MKKSMIITAGGLLVTGLLAVGVMAGKKVYAQESEIGAAGAAADTEYTLEEMLTYAIEDEYLAQTEYDAIMDTYGVQRPFSNIIQAEATHISLLEPLFEEYGVSVPQKDWTSLIEVPESLEAAYAAGVTAEENNIAMYERFLKENLPEDVQTVFEELRDASLKHLAAFERQTQGTGNFYGRGNENGRGNETGTGEECNSSNIGSRGRNATSGTHRGK